MTATTVLKDDKLTVSFSYTADTDIVQDVLGACAEYLWQEEEVDGEITNPFDEATNEEMLAVVDKHVKSVLLDMANSFKSNEAQRVAREAEAKLTL